MGVVQNYESAEGRERWKWEHQTNESHPSDSTIKGMRPEYPQAYPAMLYKVTNRNPMTFESYVVTSENEQRNMESRGFVAGGKGAAVAEFDKSQQALAVGAAHRAYEDRNMSPNAQAEAEAKELTSIAHMPEIAAEPIKRRGRPRKSASVE